MRREVMCYRAGPLISPQLLGAILVPRYAGLTSFLREKGISVVFIDCDGDIAQLVPVWLSVRVNCMFPLEVGTRGPIRSNTIKNTEKNLLMIGGVSKLILAESPQAVTRGVERLVPLVEEGLYPHTRSPRFTCCFVCEVSPLHFRDKTGMEENGVK